jgi:hypothetical protein
LPLDALATACGTTASTSLAAAARTTRAPSCAKSWRRATRLTPRPRTTRSCAPAAVTRAALVTGWCALKSAVLQIAPTSMRVRTTARSAIERFSRKSSRRRNWRDNARAVLRTLAAAATVEPSNRLHPRNARRVRRMNGRACAYVRLGRRAASPRLAASPWPASRGNAMHAQATNNARLGRVARSTIACRLRKSAVAFELTAKRGSCVCSTAYPTGCAATRICARTAKGLLAAQPTSAERDVTRCVTYPVRYASWRSRLRGLRGGHPGLCRHGPQPCHPYPALCRCVPES